MGKTFFIGIGGCGINTVNHWIKAKQISADKACCLNINQEDLERSLATINMLINKKNSKKIVLQIKKRIQDAEAIVIVAGLGGYAGSTFLPIILKSLVNSGLKLISVVIKPFAFEGKERRDITQQVITELTTILSKDILRIYENQQILSGSNRDQPLTDAFVKLSKKIMEDIAQ